MKHFQYPLHHVPYAPAKFEDATSNGLEEDTITRNVVDESIERQTDRRMKSVYPFFKRKSRYENRFPLCSQIISIYPGLLPKKKPQKSFFRLLNLDLANDTVQYEVQNHCR